jgi:hypothetical protein
MIKANCLSKMNKCKESLQILMLVKEIFECKQLNYSEFSDDEIEWIQNKLTKENIDLIEKMSIYITENSSF